MPKLNTGITVDIRGNDIVVEGNTFHIKDDLKALGMKFRSRGWRYTPKTDDDAISFLRTLKAEFPGWGAMEFGDLLEVL